MQLDSDQATGPRIDNSELKSLKMELTSLKRNYKLIKMFGSFEGDLTVLTSELFLIKKIIRYCLHLDKERLEKYVIITIAGFFSFVLFY